MWKNRSALNKVVESDKKALVKSYENNKKRKQESELNRIVQKNWVFIEKTWENIFHKTWKRKLYKIM